MTIVEILPADSSNQIHTICLDDDTSECTSTRSAHVNEHSEFLFLPTEVGIISIVGPLVVDAAPLQKRVVLRSQAQQTLEVSCKSEWRAVRGPYVVSML